MTGLVVVVVVTARLFGGGGGGAETMCDSGSEAQPPSNASAPQKAATGIDRQAAGTGFTGERRERIVFFIALKVHWQRN
jgi:hypothetical protein